MSQSVAVIHHRRFNHAKRADEVLISTSVDTLPGSSEWFDVADDGEVRGRIIDRFLELWNEHGDTGLILYVADPVVRALLQEQAAGFLGLVVRDVIAGERLQAAWQTCRRAHHDAEVTRNPLSAGPVPLPERPRLVIATDASRGTGSRVTGLGAVTTAGNVRMAAAETNSILAGEFAAVTMALTRWWEKASRIDVLTDSLQVCRRLNGRPSGARKSGGRHEDACLDAVRELERLGVAVGVHWVRGHNGHPLNELADRAAVAARRCAQWDLPVTDRFAERMREELARRLVDVAVADLLPAVAA